MPLIDSRGRLFGRVNLIDVIVVLLVVLLIPLGYGAYALFKQPPPKIVSVEPPSLIEGKDLTVTVHGQNFRAFWDAGVGKKFAKEFLVASPTTAEIKLPDGLAPGKYDLSLYDAGQLMATLPAGLTILPTPPPPPPVQTIVATQVIGSFINLTKQDLEWLKAGSKLPDGPAPMAEVLSLNTPKPAMRKVKLGGLTAVLPATGNYQAEAALRLNCVLAGDFCTIGGVLVQPGAALSLPSKTGALAYAVVETRPLNDPPSFPAAKTAKLLGTFEDITADEVKRLKPGLEFAEPGQPPVARIEEVQDPVRTQVAGKFSMFAIITVKCRMLTDGCWTGEAYLTSSAKLNLPHRRGAVRFTVQEARDLDQPLALPPTTWVRALGVFIDLDKAGADALKAGTTFPEGASDPPVELVSRGDSAPAVAQIKVAEDVYVDTLPERRFQVPAVLRLRCTMASGVCTVLRDAVVNNGNIRLAWRGRTMQFVVRAVEGDATPKLAQVGMRFVMREELLPLMKEGAQDTGRYAVDLGPAHSACVVSMKGQRAFDSSSSFEMFGDRRIFNQVQEKIVTVDTVVQMPLQEIGGGWTYHGQPVKLGGILAFETPKYLVRGWVLDVTPGAAPAPSPCAVTP